jgi:hypothetical protein
MSRGKTLDGVAAVIVLAAAVTTFISLSLLAPQQANADPRDLERFTSFELGDLGPDFDAPNGTASFSGGASARIGVRSLYHSGARSWRVPANGGTTIIFDPPAKVVELMALDQSGNNATMTARTADDIVIDSIDLTGSFPSPMAVFTNPYRFENTIDGVATLVVTNGSGDAWLDSFGFTPVPEPTAGAASLTALLALAGLARRPGVPTRDGRCPPAQSAGQGSGTCAE